MGRELITWLQPIWVIWYIRNPMIPMVNAIARALEIGFIWEESLCLLYNRMMDPFIMLGNSRLVLTRCLSSSSGIHGRNFYPDPEWQHPLPVSPSGKSYFYFSIMPESAKYNHCDSIKVRNREGLHPFEFCLRMPLPEDRRPWLQVSPLGGNPLILERKRVCSVDNGLEDPCDVSLPTSGWADIFFLSEVHPVPRLLPPIDTFRTRYLQHCSFCSMK